MGQILAIIVAAVLCSTPLAAQTPLTVVEVNAPAVNCVFQPTCVIPVSDTTGPIPLPYLTSPGTAFLQSRIFPTAPGTPAAGLTGYVYRISLTEASGNGECLSGLVLNFGPVVKLPYLPAQQADVFVVTSGGLGTIGIKSAQKTGDVIDFALSNPLAWAARRTSRIRHSSSAWRRARHRSTSMRRSRVSASHRSTRWMRACRTIERNRELVADPE